MKFERRNNQTTRSRTLEIALANKRWDHLSVKLINMSRPRRGKHSGNEQPHGAVTRIAKTLAIFITELV